MWHLKKRIQHLKERIQYLKNKHNYYVFQVVYAFLKQMTTVASEVACHTPHTIIDSVGHSCGILFHAVSWLLP